MNRLSTPLSPIREDAAAKRLARCRRLAGIGLFTLLPSLLAVQQAWADADDTFSITPGVSYLHDDNLFRLSSSADPNSVLGKSTKADDIVVSRLGLKINKPYSLQRFELEADVEDHRYRNFDYLDFTAVNYAAAWRWSLTPHFHGNLTSTRKEDLNSFVDYTAYGTRNLRTEKKHRLDGMLDVSGSWRLLGGVEQISQSNSQTFNEESDTRLRNVDAGVGYEFRSGNSISLVSRGGRGEYVRQAEPIPFPALLDNRFDQRENEARVRWAITAKTSLDARFARLERTHEHFAQRDFAGNVGSVLLKWEITAKTALIAEVARDLYSFQSLSSSYVQADRLTLSPSWQITAKTALRGRYDYVKRDYRGAIADTPLNDRADTLQDAMIALEWQALRTLLVTTSLQSARRTSNQAGFDYRSNMAGVAAQITF